MKTSAARSFLRVLVLVCAVALTVSGAWAATANTFILSDEAPGHLITMMVNAGYGDYNLYNALVAIQAETDPSVSGIITDQFLASLAACPAGSPFFTTKLNTIAAGSSVAISDDCTVQFVSIHGLDYYNAGYPTLSAAISGVGRGLFTHSSDSQTPLTSWQANGNTYNVFAIGWATAQQNTNAIPTLGGLGLLGLALVVLAIGAGVLREL